jgi:hypothetical protein
MVRDSTENPFCCFVKTESIRKWLLNCRVIGVVKAIGYRTIEELIWVKDIMCHRNLSEFTFRTEIPGRVCHYKQNPTLIDEKKMSAN